jgi:hypothetical protein
LCNWATALLAAKGNNEKYKKGFFHMSRV